MATNSNLEHWNQQAELYKQDDQATMPDRYLRQLELQNLVKYIRPQDRILDVGCGNGFGTLILAQATANEVVGIDFSPEMIKYASEKLASWDPAVRQRVRFAVGNVLELPSELGTFDTVTSARCLINLPDEQHQLRALHEMHARLRLGGRAVLSEDTVEGWSQVNSLRRLVELPDLPIRWHNHYLDLSKLLPKLEPQFKVVTTDDFSSTYYIVSRIVYARLAADKGEEPRYDAAINRIAAQLPTIGNYGLLRIIVLERR